MICGSGYIMTKCEPPHPERVIEAEWLLPHFKEAKKTVNCTYNIANIREDLGLDTLLEYGYHSKGAIAMKLIEAGFEYKLCEYGIPYFNLSRKFKIGATR